MNNMKKVEFVICEFIYNEGDLDYTEDTPPLFILQTNLPITLPLTRSYDNKDVVATCNLFMEGTNQIKGIAEVPGFDLKYYPSLKFNIVPDKAMRTHKANVIAAALCKGSMQSLKEQLKAGRASILSN
jgi:hypothetical protein